MPDPVLDAHHHELLRKVVALTAAVPPEQLTLARRRALAREANALLLPPEGALPVQRRDLRVDLPGRSLPARLYQPVMGWPRSVAEDVLLVYFHGGGWVVCDLETHDNGCAFLAQRLGCHVLSVEYRKAPEHPFPAPCDDAVEAYAWAAARMGTWGCRRIAVSGDSAGAHLAAVAMYANPDLSTAAALLFYPVADMDFSNSSYARSDALPGLTRAGMLWYWEQFLGSTEGRDDAHAVPMRQRWGRVPPPTVVALAWHDPLYDEGRAYAELLRAAGAEVHVHDAQDMAHGYLRQCRINAAAGRHVEKLADALLDLLGKPAA